MGGEKRRKGQWELGRVEERVSGNWKEWEKGSVGTKKGAGIDQ